MLKLSSHMSESDHRSQMRTYTGEEECRALVDWLNREGKTGGGLKIQTLLTYAHDLSQAGPISAVRGQEMPLRVAVSEQVRFWESAISPIAAKRAARLRRVLKMVGVPKVGVTVNVRVDDTGRLRLVLATGRPWGEALLTTLRLDEMGVIDRVRKCPRCGKWFFARFRHQRFCQLKCQQKHFRESEAWKEHRRRWMRDYYRKTRDRKAHANIR
jgi:ribosomal protein S27AE